MDDDQPQTINCPRLVRGCDCGAKRCADKCEMPQPTWTPRDVRGRGPEAEYCGVRP